jgi:hypothetical protein
MPTNRRHRAHPSYYVLCTVGRTNTKPAWFQCQVPFQQCLATVGRVDGPATRVLQSLAGRTVRDNGSHCSVSQPPCWSAPSHPNKNFFWFQLGRAPVEARQSHDHLRVQHLHLNRPRWWSDFGRKYTANARVNPMVNSVT